MTAGVVMPPDSKGVRCPRCRSSDLAHFLYGEPAADDDLDAIMRARRVALGGCVVSEADPVWRCNVCWHHFGTTDDAPMPTRASLGSFRVSLPGRETQSSWRVGRLVLTGSAAPEKPRPNPRVVLEAALSELVRQEKHVDYLVTPAGFLRAAAGPDVRVTRGWCTPQSDFDILRRVAEDIAIRNLSDVLQVARGHVTYLVVGVDVHLASDDKPRAQVALVIDVERRRVVGWTGKSYPKTGKEEQNLVRNSDLPGHVMGIEKDRVAILVCHDLVAWTGRSAKNRKGDRETAGRCLQYRIAQARPNLVLHLPHTIERTGTWVAAWNRLKADLGKEGLVWASAIAYLTTGWRRPTPALPRGVRARTRSSDRDVLDIIIGD